MTLNPEFQRQLWLEFSPLRLAGMPAVLALMFLAVGLVSPQALPMAALITGVLLAWGYGAHAASSALLDEVHEQTWDAQRLSSLTPWQLTWGKLAGGTLYAWYGAAICAAVWLGASQALGQAARPATALLVVAVGVVVQATGLIAALASVERGRAGKRRGGWWWLGVLLLLQAAPLLFVARGQDDLVWWGARHEPAHFYAATAVVFAAWAVLGATRLMGSALKLAQTPWAWVAFIGWLTVFGAGFIPWGTPLVRLLVLGSVLASAAAYATLFVEPPRLNAWQRFAAHWRDATRWPLLPVSIGLALALGLAALLLPGATAGAAAFGAAFSQARLPLVLALVALRDMALVCALFWAMRTRRPEATALLLLLVLNLLLPWVVAAAGARTLASWLQPVIDTGSGPALGAALVQAAVALALAWRAWQRHGAAALSRAD